MKFPELKRKSIKHNGKFADSEVKMESPDWDVSHQKSGDPRVSNSQSHSKGCHRTKTRAKKPQGWKVQQPQG